GGAVALRAADCLARAAGIHRDDARGARVSLAAAAAGVGRAAPGAGPLYRPEYAGSDEAGPAGSGRDRRRAGEAAPGRPVAGRAAAGIGVPRSAGNEVDAGRARFGG